MPPPGRGTADSKVLSSGNASILTGIQKWVVGSPGQLTQLGVTSVASESEERARKSKFHLLA